MTTPLPEDSGFSDYALGIPIRYRLTALPERDLPQASLENVDRCVDIPIRYVPTVSTYVSPYRQGLRHNLPTGRTPLARPVRGNLHHPRTGTFSLALKDRKELCPTSVRNRLGKVMVPNHPLHIQVLNEDRRSGLGVSLRDFEVKVSSLPTHLQVRLGDLDVGL